MGNKQFSKAIRGVLRHPGSVYSRVKPPYGFTLIELLVVIGIISVLMGILLPTLNLVREQARKISCQSNMRQMGLALQTYLPDSDYWLPPSSCHISNPKEHWLYILTQYTKEDLLVRCPSDKGKVFVDWSQPLDEQPDDARYSSFAINALLDPTHYRYSATTNPYNNVDRIRHPMYCIWISEAPDTENFQLADHIHPESWEGSIEYAKEFVAWDRHKRVSNYLFADGHTETLSFEETYDWPNVCYWYPDTAPGWPEEP